MTAKAVKDSAEAGMHIGMELGANAVASQYLTPNNQQQQSTSNETESKASVSYGFDLTTPTKGKSND